MGISTLRSTKTNRASTAVRQHERTLLNTPAGSADSDCVKLLALGFAAGAVVLLLAGLATILKGRVGAGIVLGVIALVVGGMAGTLAAYAVVP